MIFFSEAINCDCVTMFCTFSRLLLVYFLFKSLEYSNESERILKSYELEIFLSRKQQKY